MDLYLGYPNFTRTIVRGVMIRMNSCVFTWVETIPFGIIFPTSRHSALRYKNLVSCFSSKHMLYFFHLQDWVFLKTGPKNQNSVAKFLCSSVSRFQQSQSFHCPIVYSVIRLTEVHGTRPRLEEEVTEWRETPSHC